MIEDGNQPSAKRLRRTQFERREEADQLMVDAAINLIAERGVRGLVLGEVGKGAGYSTTLPVHYYKTKEALILLVADRIIADFDRVLHAESSKFTGKTGLKAVQAFVHIYLQYASDWPRKRRALFMILSESAVDAQLRDGIAILSRNGIAGVVGMIRDGQSTGEIEPMVDAETFGTLIFSWLRGIVALWVVDPTIDLKRLAIGVEGTVVRILRNREFGAPGIRQSS